MALFIENQNRDQDDLKRYIEFYGPEADYTSEHLYDIIVDTTGGTPETVSLLLKNAITDAFEGFGTLPFEYEA